MLIDKRKRSPQRLIRVFSPDKATYKKDVGNFKTPLSREFYQVSCEMHGPSQSKLLGYENGRFLNVIIHWNKAAKKDITKLKTKLFFGVSIFFVAVLLLTPLALADWMDVPSDKRLHFKAGLCLSGMIYMISRSERNSREKSFVQSFSIGTLAGILYELVWDDLIKGVGADWEDSLYVTLGSATGSAFCASLDYILFKEFNFTMSIPF